MRIPNWCRGSLQPDEVIGAHEMLRWWLLPQNTLFNVYLHRHTGVDPRYLHDHPGDNISVRLRGELVEFRPAEPSALGIYNTVEYGGVRCWFWDDGTPMTSRHLLGRITWRRAEDAHRLEMGRTPVAWTLWIRFRNRRRWGYFEPKGWRPAKTVRQP